MDYIFTIYSIVFFASAMISFFVAFLAIQRKNAKSAVELHFLMLATALWALTAMFESAALQMAQKILWAKIEYLFAPTVPVLFFLFVLSFTRKDRYITIRNILLLLIIPFASTLIAATNGAHHYLWTGYSTISSTTNLMLYSHGWWFWVGYTGYSYLIFLWSTLILYQFLFQYSKLFRWQALAVFIGGLFPWTASIMYVTGLNPIPGLNITPLSIIASGSIMASVILYNRLLSLAPIARDLLVENLEDGILVLDAQKRIQDINQSAMNYLGVRSRNVIGLPLELTDASLSPLYQYIAREENIERLSFDADNQEFWFTIQVHNLNRRNESKLIVIRDITKAVTLEQSLSKSEDYYRNLVKSIPDMLFVLDNDGVFIDCKASSENLYLPPEKFLGLKFQNILPQHIVSLFENAIKASRNSNEISEIQYELPINGIDSYFQARLMALSSDKLLCIVRDTTRQVTYEKELRESEENFRSFFETIDDIIVICSQQGSVLFCNPSVEKKLGYNFAELKESGLLVLIPTEMKGKAQIRFSETINGKRNHCSLPLQRKDGSLMPVDTRLWLGTWNNQPCVFRISKDLSKEQEALQKFNKLFDNNPALMAVSKIPENIFLDVNKAFINASGYSKEEIIGRTAQELGLFFNNYDYKKSILNYLHHGKFDRLEVQITTKNGESIIGLLSGETIESQGEKLLLTVLTDISKQKEAEANLLLAKQAAEMANKAKSEFLANMSHEIRTPMNSILGFSEIMLNSTEDPKHREFLQTILSSGNTLLSLINDILDLSKVEAGRMEIKPEYTILKTTISEIKQLFELKATQSGIDLLIKYDNEMPKTVLIDEVRLRQVLLNVVGNAVKFTKEGHVSIEVTLLNKVNDTIFFEIGIEDTGIGIPATDLVKIFDAFSQQSGHDSRTYGGTGLGLAICKRLMELMGGEIKVESKVGRGSRFILYFNNVPFVADTVSKKESFVWDVNVIEFAPAKILIVDDVEHNRFLVKAYLGRYGFELLEAENGQIAVEMTKKHKPNLVLMDIRMPVLDGFEATKILKANPATSSIPIVALTASTLQNEVDEIKHVFDYFMFKPLKKNTLISLLKDFLEHKVVVHAENDIEETMPSVLENETESIVEISFEIKQAFTKHFASDIAEQKVFMLIDSLSDLALRIQQYADENELDKLKKQAMQLKKDSDAFDFELIQNTLSRIEEDFCLKVD
jgi:PAS domain S-box-containing protein